METGVDEVPDLQGDNSVGGSMGADVHISVGVSLGLRECGPGDDCVYQCTC